MSQVSKQSLLKRIILRFKRNNDRKFKYDLNKARPFTRNTAILNETPKGHKPKKNKVVQK